MKTQLRREAESPKIAFYEAIEDELDRAISVSAARGRVLRVLRDTKAYFPERNGVDVRQDWDMLTGEDVADYRPDWILIETENLTRFGDSTILAEAIDEKELIPIYAFLRRGGAGRARRLFSRGGERRSGAFRPGRLPAASGIVRARNMIYFDG